MTVVGGIFFALTAILIIVSIVLSKAFIVVPHKTTMIIERLGKFKKLCKPGLHVILPGIDKPRSMHASYVTYHGSSPCIHRINTPIVDTRETVLDFGPHAVITRDAVSIRIDAVLFFKITDAALALLKIRNVPITLELLTKATLRNIMADITLDDSFSSRELINKQLLDRLRPDCRRFGIEVTRVEVQDILIDSDILSAMEIQLSAERNRRAMVLSADGTRESNIITSTGDGAVQIIRGETLKKTKISNAKANAKVRLTNATAESEAIETFRQTLNSIGSSIKAVDYFFALRYIQLIHQIPKQVLFIPDNSIDLIESLTTKIITDVGKIKNGVNIN